MPSSSETLNTDTRLSFGSPSEGIQADRVALIFLAECCNSIAKFSYTVIVCRLSDCL